MADDREYQTELKELLWEIIHKGYIKSVEIRTEPKQSIRGFPYNREITIEAYLPGVSSSEERSILNPTTKEV